MNTKIMGASSRLAWRLLIVVCAALLVGATGANADPVKTLVQDTLYRADGSVAHGRITVRWDGFSSIEGEAVPAGEKSWTTDNNGAIAIPLIPNVGSTPAGGYYKVVIRLDDGTTSEERWVIPAAASTTVAAIRTQLVSQSVAAQFVHLTGPDSIQGKKSFVISPEVPDPTDGGGVANKKYVDQQLLSLSTVASTGNYNDLVNKPSGSTGPVQLPVPTATTLGGIKGNGSSLTCATGQVLNGFNADGSPGCVESGGGAYLSLAGGSLTGPLNGSVGAFSGAVAAGTTVSANDSMTKATPLADIRSYGAKCDGVTDDTAALQAAITALRSTGGKIGTFGNCYFANPAGLTWGNGPTILISGQGSWTVGTTFPLKNNVHIEGNGGAGGVQFQSRPLFSISGKGTTGTLGTATAVGTATFTPSSMTNIVPGTAISIAGSQSCTISSVTRASNVVTATLSASCRTPAGTQITIASVTDASFNGSFLATQSDYGKNTISWQQTATNSSSSGGTLVGVNEKSLETVAIIATTSTTATASFVASHSATDLFGVVVVAAVNQLSNFSLKDLGVGGCGGSCIWLSYSANFDFDNVGAGANSVITSTPLELSTSWWGTISKGSFLNSTYPGSPSQPWGIRFSEVAGPDASGMLSIRDTTVGGGIKIDSHSNPKNFLAGQVVLDRVVVERPVAGGIVIEPGGGQNIGTVNLHNFMLQDNFAGYSPCTVYYTDRSGIGNGGFNITQDVGLNQYGGNCITGGYFDGSLNLVSRDGNARPTNPANSVGVWNNGRALEAEIRGSGAGMSPQLIPYPTANIPDPQTWASGQCTVTPGVTGPDGSATAISLTYNTATWMNAASVSYATNTGDYFLYGAWVKSGSGTTAMGGDGMPFYLEGAGTDKFSSGGTEDYPRNFQSYMYNDWWTPVVALTQMQYGDGGAHWYTFRAECPGAGGGSLQLWGPFMIHLPASTPLEEVQRLRQQLLHGYVPPNMPGGQILAMNPNHKLYWGNDTNLYRSAAGMLKTDGAINAVGGLLVNGVPVAGGSSVTTLDFKAGSAAPTGTSGTNPFTYVIPASAHTLEVVVMSGAGGGGAGGVAATSGNMYGGGGGQGGCAQVYTVPASYFGGTGATITVVVGPGGAGGAAASGLGTAVTGTNGTGGGVSYIAGSNGVSISSGYMGSAAGSGGAIGSGAGGGNNCNMIPLQGSLGAAGSLTVGGTSIDGTAPKAGAGGAGGGGISGSGTVDSAGGRQGNGASVQEMRMPALSATSGGVVPGGAGQTPTIGTSEPMVFGAMGGTGGASSVSTNGGKGGDGMFPGGGGAGGGASVPGSSSGAGGKGGDGMVRIIVQ